MKLWKLSTGVVLCLVSLMAIQPDLSARDRGGKRSRTSVSLNFNLGLFNPGYCAYDYYDCAPYYERTVIRECRPRIRERVVYYERPYCDSYCEEVYVMPGPMRPRMFAPYWW